MAGPGLTAAHLNTCVTHGETYRGVSLYTRAWCWVCTRFCIRRGRKSCDEGPYGELRAELSYFLLVSQPTLRSRSGTHHWAVSLVTLPLSHGCSDILLNKWPGLVFFLLLKKNKLKKKKSVCGWVCACEYSVHCGGRVGCRGFPRAGVTGRCKLPHISATGSGEPNSGHLQEQHTLLTTEPSFRCSHQNVCGGVSLVYLRTLRLVLTTAKKWLCSYSGLTVLQGRLVLKYHTVSHTYC